MYEKKNFSSAWKPSETVCLRASGGDIGGGSEALIVNDIAGTLDSNYYKGCGERQGVEREVVLSAGNGQTNQISMSEQANTLDTMHEQQAILEKRVRRLTPLECTRLQWFPDGWVDIGDWTDDKGKVHKDADSPKYKALGNSIALPFWEWMAKRMVKYLPENATMGSLFDGIGGFPLVYSRAGVTPVWASEIEQFPMAVTKRRFPV